MANKRVEHKKLYACLGKTIQDRRKRRGMSQADLAEESGVDRSFISDLERARRNPSFGAVASIADGLDVRYSRLIADCEKCVSFRRAG
jgi:transcriptional regulator with XRE-family HTH domain